MNLNLYGRTMSQTSCKEGIEVDELQVEEVWDLMEIYISGCVIWQRHRGGAAQLYNAMSDSIAHIE